VPITADATAGQLRDRLAGLGAARMSLALATLVDGTLEFKPQPEEGVTYAKKIDKNETRIDWSQPWKKVHDHIRGLSPFPGAWFEIGGTRVRALGSTRGDRGGEPGIVLDGHLTIACGEGALRLTQVQRAGAKAMAAEEFLRGTPIPARTMLA
jgi:methionyl-tRNA formyltransferase